MAEQKRKLYGRKWEITIYKPSGDKEKPTTKIDVSSLRCVFQTTRDIDSSAVQTCTLAVYNMNAQTEKEVIEEGFQISIYGGYQEGQYGEIFTGDVVQVFRNREDGVNYRLEIIAIRGIKEFCSNFVRSTLAAGSTPRKIAEAAVARAEKPVEVEKVSDKISQQKLPRGKVLFGTPEKYLRDICKWNNSFFWIGEQNKMELQSLEDEIPKDKCIELTPPAGPNGSQKFSGLVGTPVYSDGGINIKMLLDARIKFYTLIKIDNEMIRRQAIQIGNAMQALNGKGGTGGGSTGVNQNQVFDKDGEYMVFKYTHSGDTWGDDWTTTVTACSRNGRNASVPLNIAQNGATEVN